VQQARRCGRVVVVAREFHDDVICAQEVLGRDVALAVTVCVVRVALAIAVLVHVALAIAVCVALGIAVSMLRLVGKRR